MRSTVARTIKNQPFGTTSRLPAMSLTALTVSKFARKKLAKFKLTRVEILFCLMGCTSGSAVPFTYFLSPLLIELITSIYKGVHNFKVLLVLGS